MSKELRCPICSEPTAKLFGKNNIYGLCKEHSKMQKNGELIQCSDCGTWHHIFEKCECKKLTCLICGNDSKGKHFCLDCWKEYKNKSIDLRLKNLKFDKIIDKYGNLQYKCEDGRWVRSSQEQTIANTLWSMKIQFVYEEVVNYLSEEDKMKELHPDFYLPEYNVYIEHIGFSNKNRENVTKYKSKIYEEQGKKVIFTTPENLKDFKRFLKNKLNITK